MNWGIGLLGFLSVVEDVADKIIWGIQTFFFSFLYWIWKLLATFVDSIEEIFRNLAGIGSTNTDMASAIISDPTVGTVFANLVAISTAILIFFTIVKIIQEHYKEKEGGNPYIIVFRMFKGMLMFFFVTGAVLVGVYASGVVFRALDAATGGGGKKTVSGQIFTAMAKDASYLRLGEPGNGGDTEDSSNAAYRMVIPQNGDTRCYTVVTCSGATISNKQVKAALARLPKWEIVDAQGNVTTLGPGGEVDENSFEYDWENTIYHDGGAGLRGDKIYDDYFSNEDGHLSAGATVGYHNDLLSYVTLHVEPAIDLSWSPIEIWEDKWSLHLEEHETDTSPSVMGSKIPIGFRKYKFKPDTHIQIPISENDMFSINLHAGVSLQGGDVKAEFSLDSFMNQAPIEKILVTLVANMLLSQLGEWGMRKIPALPLWLHVSAAEIDLAGIAGAILQPLFDCLLGTGLETLTGGLISNGNDFIKIGSGGDLPVTIRRYEFDDNFQDLWGQMVENWEKIKASFDDQLDTNMGKYKEALNEVDLNVNQLQQQLAWSKYMGIVQDYNNTISSLLARMGTYLEAYDNDSLLDGTFNSNADRDSTIQVIYKDLIETYSNFKSDANKYRPTAYQSRTYNDRIYKPIFTTTKKASDSNMYVSVDDIKTSLVNDCTYNVAVDPDSYNGFQGAEYPGAFYKMVDWSAYSSTMKSKFKNYADLASYDAGLGFTFAGTGGGFEYLTHMKGGLAIKTERIGSGAYEFTLGKFTDMGIYHGGTYYKEKITSDGKTDIQTDAEFARDVFTTTPKATGVQTSNVNSLNLDSLKLTTQSADHQISPETQRILDQMGIITIRRTGGVKAKGGENGENHGSVDETKQEAKALKKWMRQKRGYDILAGKSEISLVKDYRAEQLDDLMARRNAERTYLMIGEGTGANAWKQSTNQTGFVGVLSYTDTKTVKALYDQGSINMFIGMAGIIVVLGVYMNFVFGLIQRAVNMGVLYMMSPVTIAFYPFDDGSKFQSSFISPFYKETISAFAIILSLNLFFVLFSVVSDAAVKATANAPFIDVLVLMAFVSMLPKIRESITSILGAASIQSKGLADIAKDAGNALGGKKWGAAAKGLGNFVDRQRKSAAKRRERFDKMKKAVGNKLGNSKWMQERRKKKQALADEVDAWRKDPANTKLSKAGQRLARLQDKKANAQLEKEKKNGTAMTEAKLRTMAAAGDQKAAKKLARMQARAAKASQKLGKNVSVDQLLEHDRKKELLKKDKNVRNDHRGAFNKARDGILAVGGAGKKAVSKVKGAAFKVRQAGAKAKNAVQGALKYSTLGNVMETLFHPATGMLANSNTFLGKAIKWSQPGAQKKRWDEMDKAEAEWRSYKHDITETKQKRSMDAMEGIMQADKIKEETIKKVAAQMMVNDSIKNGDANFKEAYRHMAIKDLMAKGADEVSAKLSADAELQYSGKSALMKTFQERGGMAAYVNDLVNDRNGIAIEEKYMAAAAQDVETMIKNNDVESLKGKMKTLDAGKQDTVKSMVAKFVSDSGLNLTKEQSANIDSVVMQSINNGENMEQLVEKVCAQIPADQLDTTAVRNNLINGDFDTKVSQMQMDLGTENAVVAGAMSYLKKRQSADENIYKDMNVHIDSAQFKEFEQSYRMMYDPNMQGGLIQQRAALLNQFDGDASNPEYVRQVEALTRKISSAYDAALEALGSNKQAFIYDYSVRQIEREEAELIGNIGKQMEKRLDWQLSVNMTTTAKDAMLKDTKILNMKLEGDYEGAARLLNEAVDAAKRQDLAALQRTGVDAETVEKFMKMSETSAGMRDLESMQEYADINLKFLGNVDGITGGPTTQAARNQMAAIHQVVETKQVTEFLNTKLKMVSGEEAGYRKELALAEKTVRQDFNGTDWEILKEKLGFTFAAGFPDMKSYMEDVLHRVSIGKLDESSPEFQELTDKLSNAAQDWPRLKEKFGLKLADNAASGVLTRMTNAMQKGVRANVLSAEQDDLNFRIQRYLKAQFESQPKLFGEGDKKD